MGTYGLKGVMIRWEAGKLTNEQAIGQILQLLEIVEMQLNELERRKPPREDQRYGLPEQEEAKNQCSSV